MRVLRLSLCLAAAGIVAAAVGLAEDRTYGTTATSYVTIGSADLQPENNVQGYVRAFGILASTGNFYATPHLPSGAALTTVILDYCDDDGGLSPNFTWFLVDKTGQNLLSTGAFPPLNVPAGCTELNLTVAGVTVDNAANRLLLQVNVVNPIQLNGFRLGYKLQVSPAPGTATFNDVPTSDFGFQYIEALAASGITGGCGGGNYCPDNPVTRRQMAIFLSKALGLQWP